MAELRCEELTKRFGAVSAVEELSFAARPGEVTGFLGPNGAGKTTTMRMLVGLVAPSSGSALVDGRRYHDLEVPRRTVGAVLEASSAHPGRTGRQHLEILALAARVGADRVAEVLDLVDLTGAADRKAGGYSLGMRQRLALAAAMLGDPEVLLLDEPANGLDPEGMRWLRQMLRTFADEGRTVLLSSHVLSEVAQTVDSVVIVNAGRLRFAGALAELTGDGSSLEEEFLRLTADQDVVGAGGRS